ncbi:MAG: hypothetical protein AAF515_12925 [Pseudomonadota bacterium]
MKSSPIPQTYDEWRHCITVECAIPLTPTFVAERLAVWRNETSQETQRFRKLYGDDYWRAVIGWFEHAQTELSQPTG